MEKILFRRVASRLLLDESLDEKPQQIKYKLVESILFDNYKTPLTANEILDKCHELNHENISVEDIDTILFNNDNYINHYSEEDIKYSMRVELHEEIKYAYESNTIDIFIDVFYKNNFALIKNYTSENVKDLIYDFLYKVSNNNLLEFKKIATQNYSINKEIEISKNYDNNQINIINNFLNWDNEEKNELIFRLSNIGLEFSILSNPANYDLFSQINANNKKFFLDTNILYRLLGLNGDHRKNRIETFIDNCRKTNQSLYITRYTELEFRESLTYHCSQLKKYSINNTKLFNQYSVGEDFYKYYYLWKTKNVNKSIDVFRSYLLQQYRSILSAHNISLVDEILDETETEVEKKIYNYAKSINKFKNDNFYDNDYYLWIPKKQYYDAKNILLLETLRNGNFSDFLETEYFLISTDHKLLNWDHKRSNFIPSVLLPTHWLSISIRFFSCSSDDLKSFINFINLPAHNTTINNRDLSIILKAIQEIEDSDESQEYILRGILSVKIDDILKSRNPEKIYNRSKTEAIDVRKNILENEKKRIEKLEEKIQDNDKKEKNEGQEKEKLNQKVDQLEKNLNTYIDVEKEKFFNRKMLWWYLKGFFNLLMITLILIFFFFEFFFKSYNWNISYKFVLFIENIEETTLKHFMSALNWAIFSTIIYFGAKVHKYFISNKKKKEAREEIIKQWLHNNPFKFTVGEYDNKNVELEKGKYNV